MHINLTKALERLKWEKRQQSFSSKGQTPEVLSLSVYLDNWRQQPGMGSSSFSCWSRVNISSLLLWRKKSPEQANTASRGERWAFKVERSKRRPVTLHSFFRRRAWRKFRPSHWMLRCAQSDRGPHLFYSLQRVYTTPWKVRCPCVHFVHVVPPLACKHQTFPLCSFVLLLRGARCTAGWHYGNCVQKLWNSGSCFVLFFCLHACMQLKLLFARKLFTLSLCTQV